MSTTRVILWKEWLELRQQRGLLLGILVLPMLFTLIPLAVLSVAGHAPERALERSSTSLYELAAAHPELQGLSAIEVAQALLGQQLSLLFMMMPLIIPITIAAYSIVGEKTSHTLEPLLATPVRTWELLLGKSLAALLPAVGITWIAGAVFAAGLLPIVVSREVYRAIVRPEWTTLLLVGSPLMALIAIAASVIVSSRVNDARTAQQIAGTIVLPITGIILAQLVGVLVLSSMMIVTGLIVLALLDVTTIWIATRLFRRETILTRWR
jgi:ABC-2 type transport system permease protein